MEIDVVVTVRWFGVLESVTVKLGVVVPDVPGVPEIAPAAFMVKPAGSPLTDQEYGSVPPLAAIAAE